MVGEDMASGDVVQAVVRDRVFFEESGGGVTFSGGEPLMQAEFLHELLSACRSQGLHTAVDTCGMAPTDHLLQIAPLADLFLYDLKLIEDTSHRHYTGVSNERILENLRALGRAHSNIWVRVPLIPGVNEQSSALKEAARFTSSIASVRQVNLLPFHAIGAKKSARLGRTSMAAKFSPPSPEAVAEAIKIFEDAGLQVRTGG